VSVLASIHRRVAARCAECCRIHIVRIVLVCPYALDRVGGVQTHVSALARTLRARRHEVLVIGPRSWNGSTTAEDGVALVGRAVGIRANGSVAPVTFGPSAAAGVRRTMRAFAPEVVHLHEPLIPSLSLLALLGTDAPSVGTFHAAAEASAGYRIARPMLSRAAGRLAVRTAVSDAARALVQRYFPGDYVLTPNGVEVERFSTAAALDLGARRSVLFLGRIERRKGLDVLVRAMAKLDDLDATLVVAGTGPEESACRSLAGSLGVDIRFIGQIAEDDLPGIYRGADVYCAPGVSGESFGIVLVEAMAAGAPVVCSDLDGFRAVAGAAAELVPPGDPDALAATLRAVLTDDDRREAMSKDSRRSSQMYDWRRLVAGVEAVYERASSARG
jgi:phosphatidylinositol alpha-mannosyltransferase